jgi:hypothetical protein
MKYVAIALLITLLLVSAGIYFFAPGLVPSFKPKTAAEIKSFEDCAEAGNLVVETKPRECHTKNQQVFVEVYNGVILEEVIKTTSPKPNQVVSSPFKLEGEAVGGWYYNEQLMARLEDDNGKVIATKPVKALESTKTDGFVPFVAAITFVRVEAETPKGKLIIERTNTEFSKGELGPLVIPVVFKD